MNTPACEYCGEPATCFGAYEGSAPAYACDECCGHGNEDGRCTLLEVDALRKERDALKADNERLRAEARIAFGPEHACVKLAAQLNAVQADNERLRGLVKEAERSGGPITDDSCCPWCGAPNGGHATDCPAFSAPGVVR